MAHRLQVVKGHLHLQGHSLEPSANSISQLETAMTQRPPITTHILDTALGRPARRVPLQLSYRDPDSQDWVVVGTGHTNDDGRCLGLISVGQLKPGTYKMFFDTGTYFASQGNSKPFYPYVEVVFHLEDASQHYHIPLLLSPYSYSTYRGS